MRFSGGTGHRGHALVRRHRLSDLLSAGQLPVVDGLFGGLAEGSVLDRKTLGTLALRLDPVRVATCPPHVRHNERIL